MLYSFIQTCFVDVFIHINIGILVCLKVGVLPGCYLNFEYTSLENELNLCKVKIRGGTVNII